MLDLVLTQARGLTAFYDIDTPITLAALDKGAEDYIAIRQIPRLDLYFSFTGGPTLDRLADDFGARRPCALHCAVDETRWRPLAADPRWDLGYLGTYSPDRQPALDRLLLQPARRLPQMRFGVAGPQYPAGIDWPDNVERLEHVAPAEMRHSCGATLHPERYPRCDDCSGMVAERPPLRGCFLRNANHQRPLAWACRPAAGARSNSDS